MLFLKRALVSLTAIFLISMGGCGTQSSSTFFQGFGVVSLIIGLIIVFFLGKLILKALGALPTILIIGIITFFVLYAIGALSDGISGVPNRLKSFLGSSQGVINAAPSKTAAPLLTQNLKQVAKKETPPPQKKKTGFDPTDYPSIISTASIIKSNVLEFPNGNKLRLFATDSPDLDQTCSNKQGRSYQCGKQAALWLKSWIQDYSIKCHLITTDATGMYVGVCFMGQYDLGAAVVNAGWAVATTEGGGIYKIYEDTANANRRGLWQGQFYKPQDWRNLRSQKGEIKVIKPKNQKRKEGLFGF